MKISSRAKDWSGFRFNHIEVIEPIKTVNGMVHWQVRCDCGTVKNMPSGEITRMSKKGVGVCGSSCKFASHGARKKHGKCGSPEYHSWRRMIDRCSLESNPSYLRYGGRGITVHEKWVGDFRSFLKDMGDIPEKGMTLDRINTNGNYEPKNCRWATKKEQSNNRCDNVFIDTPWGRLTLSQAAEKAGVQPSLLAHRVKANYPADKLFLKPKDVNAKWDTQWGQLTVIEACAKAGISPKVAWSRISRGTTDPDRVFSSKDLRK